MCVSLVLCFTLGSLLAIRTYLKCFGWRVCFGRSMSSPQPELSFDRKALTSAEYPFTDDLFCKNSVLSVFKACSFEKISENEYDLQCPLFPFTKVIRRHV